MNDSIDDLIRPTEAQRQSTCADCDLEIRAGDAIVLAGGAGWVHDTCPEVKPRPVCPTCFLEIPLSGKCPCQG
ncbi:hypothetical protein [Streptomyces sp. AC495_CC817]|uniref:hypothetical protein n=1 Tax=Streptomyces sp. AC495_CC817 TaxID=2823900 RepID=UPI001C25462D|nr:hypothetical protein [Streptomyces sp. AC495_CC817]